MTLSWPDREGVVYLAPVEHASRAVVSPPTQSGRDFARTVKRSCRMVSIAREDHVSSLSTTPVDKPVHKPS